MEDKCLFYIRYNSILNSENNIKNGTSNMEERKEDKEQNPSSTSASSLKLRQFASQKPSKKIKKKKISQQKRILRTFKAMGHMKEEEKSLKAKEEEICNKMKKQYNSTNEFFNKNSLIEYDINNSITSKLKAKINGGCDHIITRELTDISKNENSIKYILENVKCIYVQNGEKKLYNLQKEIDKIILAGRFLAIDRKRKLLEKKNTNFILEKTKIDLIARENILDNLLELLSTHNMEYNILQVEREIREKLNYNEIMIKYKINENDSYINENTLKELNIILKEINTLYATYFIERTKVLKYNLVDVDKIFNLYNEIRRFHYTFNKMFWNKYIY